MAETDPTACMPMRPTGGGRKSPSAPHRPVGDVVHRLERIEGGVETKTS